jgi:hypothetical protein
MLDLRQCLGTGQGHRAQVLSPAQTSASATVVVKVTGSQTTQACQTTGTLDRGPAFINVGGSQNTLRCTQEFTAYLGDAPRQVDGAQTTQRAVTVGQIKVPRNLDGYQVLQVVTGGTIDVGPLPLASRTWVRHEGTWKKATTFVNVNGQWRRVQPYVNDNGTWKAA